MGVASGCGEQESGVASGSEWVWVWLLGVVEGGIQISSYYLSLLLLYLFFFTAASLLFVHFYLLQNEKRSRDAAAKKYRYKRSRDK